MLTKLWEKYSLANRLRRLMLNTIEQERIADIDLMEKASGEVVDWILDRFPDIYKYVVFAGPGNNGGDALAVSRMLAASGFQVRTFILDFGKGLKGSPLINYNRLIEQGKAVVQFLLKKQSSPILNPMKLLLMVSLVQD